MSVTAQSPLTARFLAYLRERFPPLRHGVLIACYYSANQFLAAALVEPGEPMRFGPHTLLGAVSVLCVFFALRVVDEHKDYADDCRLHPERVLQRGLVELRHLKVAGVAAVVVALALGALRGPAALVAVLCVLAFSFLIARDFFLRDVLRRRAVLGVSLHMLVTPLIALVVFSFTTLHHPWEAPTWFWPYACLRFLLFADWEVSRKLRPDDVSAGERNYVDVFGPRGSAGVLLGLRAAATAIVILVGLHLALPAWFFAVVAGLALGSVLVAVAYWSKMDSRLLARLAGSSAMYVLAFDAVTAVAIAAHYGFGGLTW